LESSYWLAHQWQSNSALAGRRIFMLVLELELELKLVLELELEQVLEQVLE
jgi:hypothetical protein